MTVIESSATTIVIGVLSVIAAHMTAIHADAQPDHVDTFGEYAESVQALSPDNNPWIVTSLQHLTVDGIGFIIPMIKRDGESVLSYMARTMAKSFYYTNDQQRTEVVRHLRMHGNAVIDTLEPNDSLYRALATVGLVPYAQRPRGRTTAPSQTLRPTDPCWVEFAKQAKGNHWLLYNYNYANIIIHGIGLAVPSGNLNLADEASLFVTGYFIRNTDSVRCLDIPESKAIIGRPATKGMGYRYLNNPETKE